MLEAVRRGSTARRTTGIGSQAPLSHSDSRIHVVSDPENGVQCCSRRHGCRLDMALDGSDKRKGEAMGMKPETKHGMTGWAQ